MSKMLSKMNLISVVQQLPKEDIETIQGYVEMIEEENQELKKHLELPEHCNLKTIEDYKSYYEDATKEEILKDTYIDYCAYVNLAHRYAELKKQLERINEQISCLRRSIERKEERIIDLQYERIPYTNEYVDKLLNQQKEFVNYLENMLDDENDIFSVVRVKDVLQKYKSIIGVLDEKSNNISS